MKNAVGSRRTIATAQWMTPDEVEGRFLRQDGDFWIGRNAYRGENPVGFRDDRHVMVVSGSRGGKGVSVIVPNLCLWPGSLVVVDPKGENATLTAARRGDGSEHCDGMGQRVCVLDPMGAASVEEKYLARFNPLDALDPTSEHVIDDASRLADAIVEVRQGEDRQWDEGARSLVRTLILYVLTNPRFEGRRNLLTVRRLIQRGDWEAHERDKARRAGAEVPIKSPPASAHVLLWELAAQSTALDGVIAAAADGFLQSARMGPKQYESYRKIADTNTEFLDSPGMARCVEASDFNLPDLKTDPKGMSIYLSLPQRYMSTHYRWLRMMIALTVTEMEVVPGRPAAGNGSPVLLAMDEFAGLKRMEIIENTVAQIAGYGVKLFFVLQSLEQLKSVYPDRWETFLANCGVRIFFATTDNFTNQYVSDALGEQEIVRIVRNRSESSGESTSQSESSSESRSEQESTADTKGTTTGKTRGGSTSRSRGGNKSRSRGGSDGRTTGGNIGSSTNRGTSQSESVSFEPEWFFALEGLFRDYTGRQEGNSSNESSGTSEGRSWSDSTGRNWNNSAGRNWSDSTGQNWGNSRSRTRSQTVTKGSSTTTSRSTQSGSSRSRGLSEGESEQVFKKPLVTKDEMSKLFTRIDDPNHRAYPGIALVTIAGEAPMLLRRTPYYQDPAFIGLFDPHPDHPMMEAPVAPEAVEKPKGLWPRKNRYIIAKSVSRAWNDADPEQEKILDIARREHKSLLNGNLFTDTRISKTFECLIHAPLDIVGDVFFDLELHEKWFRSPKPLLGALPEPGSEIAPGTLIPSGFVRRVNPFEKMHHEAIRADLCSLSSNFNKPIFFEFMFRPRGEDYTHMELKKWWYSGTRLARLLEAFGLKKRGIFPQNNTHFLDRLSDHDLLPPNARELGWDVSEDEELEDVRNICNKFRYFCEDIAADGCPSFSPDYPFQWIKAPRSGLVSLVDDGISLPLEPGDRYDTLNLIDSTLELGTVGGWPIMLSGRGQIIETLCQDGDRVDKGDRLFKILPA